MSEAEQHDGTSPRGELQRNPPPPQASNIVVDDKATQPTYANFCRVTATPEEMILDFGLNSQPFAAGEHDVTANPRVVMNFFTAKRLFSAVGATIQRHEQSFGAIELDVNRRARPNQAQLMAADAPAANRHAETIRLNR